jgi:hypothetical protein
MPHSIKDFFDIQEYSSCRHFIVEIKSYVVCYASYVAVSSCDLHGIQTDLH